MATSGTPFVAGVRTASAAGHAQHLTGLQPHRAGGRSSTTIRSATAAASGPGRPGATRAATSHTVSPGAAVTTTGAGAGAGTGAGSATRTSRPRATTTAAAAATTATPRRHATAATRSRAANRAGAAPERGQEPRAGPRVPPGSATGPIRERPRPGAAPRPDAPATHTTRRAHRARPGRARPRPQPPRRRPPTGPAPLPSRRRIPYDPLLLTARACRLRWSRCVRVRLLERMFERRCAEVCTTGHRQNREKTACRSNMCLELSVSEGYRFRNGSVAPVGVPVARPTRSGQRRDGRTRRSENMARDEGGGAGGTEGRQVDGGARADERAGRCGQRVPRSPDGRRRA